MTFWRKKTFHHTPVFRLIFEECEDMLEALIAEKTGDTGVIRKVKETLDRIYATPEQAAAEVRLDRFVKARIQDLRPRFSHRQVTLATQLIPVRPIRIPLDPLQKVVDGLIRNAVETPGRVRHPGAGP